MCQNMEAIVWNTEWVCCGRKVSHTQNLGEAGDGGNGDSSRICIMELSTLSSLLPGWLEVRCPPNHRTGSFLKQWSSAASSPGRFAITQIMGPPPTVSHFSSVCQGRGEVNRKWLLRGKGFLFEVIKYKIRYWWWLHNFLTIVNTEYLKNVYFWF